jgi:hypothetical protein
LCLQLIDSAAIVTSGVVHKWWIQTNITASSGRRSADGEGGTVSMWYSLVHYSVYYSILIVVVRTLCTVIIDILYYCTEVKLVSEII